MMNLKKMTALLLACTMSLTLPTCVLADSDVAEAEGAAAADLIASLSEEDGALKTILEAGKIVMVTNAEFEPFEFKDGDQIVGIDPQIAQAIADAIGVELEITDIAFDSCIPSLTTGKADFCAAGMTKTPDREKNVDFSDSYFNASQAIIVSTDSDIAGREDLNGKIVGVQQGTTGDIYCTNEDGSSDIEVKEVRRYPKGMDAVSDLISGRIDAVVIDNFPATKLVEKNPDKIAKLDEALTEEEYAISLPKGSNLKEVINAVISDLEASGAMDEIISQYIEAE